MSDSLRVLLGRRIQNLGRWVAHGGKPHDWIRDLAIVNQAQCRRCGITANADMVLKVGALTGRCPR